MSKQLQLRGGTTAEHATFTGANKEVTIDTDKNALVVHDGATAGGIPTPSQAEVDLKAPIASPTFTGTVRGIDKTMVGLTNVDNTSDANKPVSTAQQTALDLKANLTGATFTGQVKGITPVANEDLARKDYVDSAVSGISGLLSTDNLLHIQDKNASGTNGGSNATSTYTARRLNTVLTNNISGASLSSNQITLPAGSYMVGASSPYGRTNNLKTKLVNISGDTVSIIGTAEVSYTSTYTSVRSFIDGDFTAATGTVLEMQYWTLVNNANGLGSATSNGDDEIFSDIKIWKVG